MQKDEFSKDILITAIGQILVIVITFLVNKIISITLGPIGYAEYSIFNKAAAVVSFIMAFSLGIAIPKFLATSHAKKNIQEEAVSFISSIKICAVSCISVTLLVFIFSTFFSELIFSHSDTLYIRVLLIFSVGTAFSTVVISYYRGLDRFLVFSLLQIIISVISMLALFFAPKSVLKYFSIRGILLFFLSLVLFISILIKYRKMRITFSNYLMNKDICGKIFHYSLPRVPGEFILFSLSAVPLIIVNKRFGSVGTAGIATALTLINSVAPFFGIIGTMLLPYVSKSIAKGESTLVYKRIKSLLVIYIILSFFAILLINLFPKLLIFILFSPQYYQFIPEVRVLSFVLVFQSIYLLLRNPLDAISNFPFNTISLCISFFAMLLSLLFLPTVESITWAIVASYFILAFCTFLAWKCAKKNNIDI